jgi:hypothetical protein
MARSVTRNRYTSSRGKEDVQTRLARRKDSKNYYYRQRIPADLKGHYGGKREVWKSLDTSDRAEAARLVRLQAVEWDQQFEKVRKQLLRGPLTSITPEETARIIFKAVAIRLQADEEGRIVGLPDWEYERHLKWLEESEKEGRHALARGQFAFFESMVDDHLWGHGYELAKDSPEYRRFAYEFVKAYVRVNEQKRQRNRGEPVDTPPLPPEPTVTVAAGTGLAAILDKWNAERKPTPEVSGGVAAGGPHVP